MKDQEALMYGAAAIGAYFLYMKNKAAPVAPATLDPTAGFVPNSPAGGGGSGGPILAGPVSTQNYYYPTSTGLPTGYGTAYQPSFSPVDPATGQPVVTPPTAPVSGGGGDNSLPVTNGQGRLVPRGQTFQYGINQAGQTSYINLTMPASGMVLYAGIRPPGDTSGNTIFDFMFLVLGSPAGPKRNNESYQDTCGLRLTATCDKPCASQYIQSGTEIIAPGSNLFGSMTDYFAQPAACIQSNTIILVPQSYPATVTFRAEYPPTGQVATKTVVIANPNAKPLFPNG